MKVYGLKNCDTCRKARKWLDANGIAHTFIDVRDSTPPPAVLEQWQAVLGDALLNRRGTTWRALSAAEQARAEGSLPALLHAHPALMKRPILVNGRQVLSGFDEKAWREMVK